jgi:hypothetical protein
MLPSWTRRVLVRTGILASVGLVILGAIWLGSESLGRDPQGDSSFSAPEPVRQESADGRHTVEVVPPRVQKEESKPAAPVVDAGKPAPLLSLAQAIDLVEKAGRGPVIRAEKLGEGEKLQFNVDVVAKDGSQKRLNVNGTGKVIVETAETARSFSGPASSFRKGSGERSRREGRSEGERRKKERRDDD